MRVLKIMPGLRAEVIESTDVFNDAKEIIGNYVEFYRPFDDNIVIICDEEGKINGSALNRGIYDEDDHELIDIIAGPFVIAGEGLEEDFIDLTNEQMHKYYSLFELPEKFLRQNNKIVGITYEPFNI